MTTPTLFTPIRLGAIEAPNRILMAPLTRMRAGAGRIPTALTARGRNAIFSTDVFCRSELAIHAASPSGSSQAAQLAA
jgi:hypothetical protein